MSLQEDQQDTSSESSGEGETFGLKDGSNSALN